MKTNNFKPDQFLDSRIPGFKQILNCLSSTLSAPRSTLFAMRYALCAALLLGLFGCTSTDELTRLQQSVNSLNFEFNRYKAETNGKLSALAKDNQTLSKQILSISTSADTRENTTKTMLGKLDELEHQLQVYWNETKTEISALKKPGSKPQAHSTLAPVSQPIDDAKYETSYREAFDAFQKGSYEEAVNKFSHFITAYSKTPLAPNAYFWLGESYMNLRNYDNAILNFQEVCDKYPKSDKVPRAMLSQAEAFGYLKDKKSSITIFKKVIELYPKSEEAIIAERKLRNLGY